MINAISAYSIMSWPDSSLCRFFNIFIMERSPFPHNLILYDISGATAHCKGEYSISGATTIARRTRQLLRESCESVVYYGNHCLVTLHKCSNEIGQILRTRLSVGRDSQRHQNGGILGRS